MCGICGYVGSFADGVLEAMTAALAHRGPDDAGFHRDAHVGLGHRRLSIIDLSGGHQPIANEDGTRFLIGNGEIYNHLELRAELEAKGHRFRTHSDNEIVLHLVEEYGPRGIERVNGMFAIAIWDERRRELLLFRDRLGIKPLYYTELPDGRFAFASEWKAIARIPEVSIELDPRGVHDYLALRYVPGPQGMIRSLRKLPAAHWGRVTAEGKLRLERYWQPPLHEGPYERRDEEYIEEFGERFERSIARRLMAEVPYGAYLSGGLDSSTIVGAMARIAPDPVRTFSVGFDYEHDELEIAAETAKRFGCRHTEIACRIEHVRHLPDIVWHLDEPVGDPIVIPMFLLAREAKKQVTVILAGEGADETLGGYLFHKALLQANRYARFLPGFLHAPVFGTGVALTPAWLLNRAFHYPAKLGRRGKQKLRDFALRLGTRRLPEAYRHLISLFDDRDARELYDASFENVLRENPETRLPERSVASRAGLLERILDLQFSHWLPEDILTKQDKLSMASAIEARVPFLDHELVEFAMHVPPHLKITNGITKVILRRYAAKLLPEQVHQRRKMPFYAPIEKFFEDREFQDVLDDTLSERTVRERGLFDPRAVTALRESMHRSEFLQVKQVFSLMVLELWMRAAIDRRFVR